MAFSEACVGWSCNKNNRGTICGQSSFHTATDLPSWFLSGIVTLQQICQQKSAIFRICRGLHSCVGSHVNVISKGSLCVILVHGS